MNRAIRWILSLLVACTVVATLFAAGLVGPASGSVWARLVFSAPGDSIEGQPGRHRVTSYELERSYDGDAWVAAGLYRAIGDTTSPIPRAPGDRETLLVSISSADWIMRAGGTRLRFRSRDASGNASGWTIVAVQVAPDTVWTATGTLAPSRSRLVGVPAFAVAESDTGSLGLEHFEATQARWLARICELYGYASRRGVRDTAWCAEELP